MNDYKLKAYNFPGIKRGILLFSMFLFMAYCLLFPVDGLCQGIKVQVEMGFADKYVAENWIPVSIIVSNEGPSISGKFIITIKNEDLLNKEERTTEYLIPVDLPQRSRKIYRKTIYYKRDYFSPVSIRLVTGDEVLYREEINLKKIFQETKILVINDNFTGYSFLNDLDQKNRLVIYQEPVLLPADWIGYQGIDLLVLDNADFNLLNKKQIRAITNWVQLGNTIIITGTGNFKTYNSHLIKELFPARFVKKRNITIDNKQGRLWQLVIEDVDVIKSQDQLALAVEQELEGGNVIFSLIEYLDPGQKEDYYLDLISEIKRNTHLEYGILDYLASDMFSAVKFYFPARYQLLLLMLCLPFFIFYLYKTYLVKKKVSISIFIAVLLISISIYSFLIYQVVVKNIVHKNNILSEIAVIKMQEETYKTVVESYQIYHALQGESLIIGIDNSKGNLSGLSTRAHPDLGQNYQFQFDDEKIVTEFNKNTGSLRSGFRSYYQESIPLYFNVSITDKNLTVKVNNQSKYRLHNIFIKYKKNWYSFAGVQSKNSALFSTGLSEYSNSSPWYPWFSDNSEEYKLPSNMTTNLARDIFETLKMEAEKFPITNNQVLIFSLLACQDMPGEYSTNRPVSRHYSGFLVTRQSLNFKTPVSENGLNFD